ncbi:MAG TPA: methylated-DNA--[protein]-cysteine S-methyltransferase [Alphaproteobacteria bacterium]|nr:methylated-DNA--[protein]-cysteine S-methyltransferase [Alphaproteobacteria bacterium]
MRRNQNDIDIFTAAVDRLLTHGQPALEAGAEPSLLDLAFRLWQSAPRAAIDPDFRARLRRRLLQRWRPAQEMTARYAILTTPIGTVYVAYRGRIICEVGMGTDDASFERRCFERLGVCPQRDVEVPDWLATRILNHLTGRRAFKDAVDLGGLTPFQQRVLHKVREIPRGEVRTYAWVAREIGFPRAVRAVGSALGKNPLPLLIPCHRVIRSAGSLGEYAAGGPERKQRLLTFEGVDLGELTALMQRGLRFRGSRNTHIFCFPTCYSRKWAKDRHTVYFASAAEARRAGYRPCKLCRPA